jgi:hypothetical protein
MRKKPESLRLLHRNILHILLHCFCISAFWCAKIYAAPPGITHTTDSLFSLDTNATCVDIIARKPDILFGATCATVNHPFDSIKVHATRFDKFQKIFSFFNSFTRANGNKLPQTYYMECNIGLTGGWCLVKVDSVLTDDSSEIRIYLSKNSDKGLEEQWRRHFKRKFRLLSVEFRSLDICFTAKKKGPDSARLCFITRSVVSISIPRWLFAFAGKRFFPVLLRDIDKYLSAVENPQ